MYSVGIAGCGSIAQVHAQALARIEGVNLSACADIKPERAQAMAEKFGCRAYASLDDMIAHEKLDVVHLCTPHVLHAPMASQLAQKGIAVFTEKPPAISREQWAMIEQAAQKVPLGICFQNRYNPNVGRLKEMMAAGELGECLGARAIVTWMRNAPYYTESGWRGAWATEGGGALINQSIHTLDLLIWLMGKPESVTAHMSNYHLKDVIEVEDTCEAFLRIGGKPVLFYASTAYTQNAPVMIELDFERATIRLENEELEIRKNGTITRQAFPMEEGFGKGYWGNGHRACIADFYDCLASGKPYRNRPSEVSATVQTMLEMYEQGRRQLA